MSIVFHDFPRIEPIARVHIEETGTKYERIKAREPVYKIGDSLNLFGDGQALGVAKITSVDESSKDELCDELQPFGQIQPRPAAARIGLDVAVASSSSSQRLASPEETGLFKQLALNWFSSSGMKPIAIDQISVVGLASVQLHPTSGRAIVGRADVSDGVTLRRLFGVVETDSRGSILTLAQLDSQPADIESRIILRDYYDHVDLDLDGQDELVTRQLYYEGSDYSFFAFNRARKEWRLVFTGGGCVF